MKLVQSSRFNICLPLTAPRRCGEVGEKHMLETPAPQCTQNDGVPKFRAENSTWGHLGSTYTHSRMTMPETLEMCVFPPCGPGVFRKRPSSFLHSFMRGDDSGSCAGALLPSILAVKLIHLLDSCSRPRFASCWYLEVWGQHRSSNTLSNSKAMQCTFQTPSRPCCPCLCVNANCR